MARPDGVEAHVYLHLGRQTFYDLGSPTHVDVQRMGSALHLIPSDAAHGYAVSVTHGRARISIGGARDLVAELADGTTWPPSSCGV